MTINCFKGLKLYTTKISRSGMTWYIEIVALIAITAKSTNPEAEHCQGWWLERLQRDCFKGQYS